MGQRAKDNNVAIQVLRVSRWVPNPVPGVQTQGDHHQTSALVEITWWTQET